MIELRYNKDGKLEYRTPMLAYSWRGWGPCHELDKNIVRTVWNEWTIVPSETKGYTSGIEEERREHDELKLRVGILEYIHDDPLRHRKECSEVAAKYCREATKEREQHAKTKARVVELEAEKKTLLESEMWGVNCKPSAPNWLAVKEASND